MKQVPCSNKKFGLVLHFFSFWIKNSKILEQLISISRLDIIFECNFNNSYIITDYYKKQFKLPDSHYSYFMAIRIGIFIRTLVIWIKNGKKETAEELVDILAEQLNFIEKNPILL